MSNKKKKIRAQGKDSQTEGFAFSISVFDFLSLFAIIVQ